VTEGIDQSVLADWMDGNGLPGGDIVNWTVLAGGTQNVLVRFNRGGRTYVLRRPPMHLRANSNEVLRREMRVLAALAGSTVPHPEFIAGCPDESVMGGASKVVSGGGLRVLSSKAFSARSAALSAGFSTAGWSFALSGVAAG
jgi:aminoglycoside phosphotransferase (APT) family kinase protein